MKKLFETKITQPLIFTVGELLIVIIAIIMLLKNYPGRDPVPETTELTAVPSITEVIFTPTVTPTVTPTSTPTPSPSPEPTSTPTPTPTPSPTPTPKTPVANGYAPGKPGYYKCEVNGKHAFKVGTDFRVYAKGTAQRRLVDISRTDERTGIRVVTDPNGVDRYLVALGTAWCGGTPADIGRCVDIYMKNGATLYCVLGDVKKVEDTINMECRYGTNHNELIEFIMDTPKLPKQTQISSNYDYCGDEFRGEATSMMVYDYFIEGFGK